jgi:phosphoribosylamine--glycine ligase
MKVLVLGSGGREHALVWKLKQSSQVREVICAPGNGGISGEATCLPADLASVDSLLQLAHRVEPDLTIVGPELPLTLGIVDEFERRGLRIFGPNQKAAHLEGSKVFAKEFMQRCHIPTAHFAICRSERELREALPLFKAPIVVKADGLAAGKGVVIARTQEEAGKVAADMLAGRMLGEAGAQVVLEEFLQGEELSFQVVTDGTVLAPLAASQDHKKLNDGEAGPNTGGMGAYSSDSLLDANMREWLMMHIARPVVEGLKAEGVEYRGVLYCGLMMTARGPMVLEFNCRLGDPETQAVLMRMESDLAELCLAVAERKLAPEQLKWSADAALCVVAVSGGYPGSYQTGKEIRGLEQAAAVPGAKVFHAGTSLQDGKYTTNGGRVLGISASAPAIATARDMAYAAAGQVSFEGMHYRKDIAARALAKK